MVHLQMRFDLRATGDTGHPALYQECLRMSAWADRQGFEAIRLSEHHGVDDGYLPSPMVMAAAIAARTYRVRVRVSALVLPLHHPLRVAEDLAVLDNVSAGRAELVVVPGYRESEFVMFGADFGTRGRVLEERIGVVRQAWTGQPFSYDGQDAVVTPRPVQRPGPPIIVGGSSEAAARRAARVGDGFYPTQAGLVEPYRAECARLGRVPAPRVEVVAGTFIHVARDPDVAWQELAPYAVREHNSYQSWSATGGETKQLLSGDDADQLRERGLCRVVSPAECLEILADLGPDGSFTVQPLMGGMPPRLGWECLNLLEHEVLPDLN